VSETADTHHDTLPEELDARGYVGAYVFPDTGRRRIAAWCYVAVAVVCLAAGAASGNEGLVGAGVFLGLVAGVSRAAAFGHRVDQTQALVTAARAMGFPLGHASAQLTWRGLRSRPLWRIACYSADDPPSRRGFVDIDALDGRVLYEHTEANPDAVAAPDEPGPAPAPAPGAAGREG
jgi:hypothetical protein